MDLPFSGGCACGAVRYVCSEAPMIAFNCHCRDCQRFAGSAYASAMIVPASALAFTHGGPKYHTTTAASGNTARRGFCAACGSPLVATQADYPAFFLYAASLDDPSWHRPAMDVWTASAQPWDHMDPALAKYPQGLG